MKSEHPESTVIRILKIATCPSMSGKSKLTYHVGCKAEAEILFRVYTNSASGFFSKEWVPLIAIQQLFGKAPDAKAITSFVLLPLFHGKSTNTPGFLFAALYSERLVQPSTTTKRCYECTDGKRFFAEVKALAATGTDLTAKLAKSAKPQGIEDKQAKSKPVKGKEQQPVPEMKKATGKSQSTATQTKPDVATKLAAPTGKKAPKKVSPKAA